jgi:hypothetical protein
MTRGRSDIYDVLTHLTFMYIESEKIRRNSEDHRGRKKRDWKMLEEVVKREREGKPFDKEVAFTYLSTILGRTYKETVEACARFSRDPNLNSIFHIAYWLGFRSTEEATEDKDREITFSSALREKIGHHYYGEQWAQNIKSFLSEKGLLDRPIHIISANLHSVMNTLYAPYVFKRKKKSLEEIARDLSLPENGNLRQKVLEYASKKGMYQLDDHSGTNITVQIYDLAQVPLQHLSADLEWDAEYLEENKPVIVVMDYAFGEQAYETLDELLKPYEEGEERTPLHIESINIMGKAGILEGGKGDIMVPTAHVFEGTADNYPIDNDFRMDDFTGHGLKVFEGPMITVLGTSLQNKDILRYFRRSSWAAIGLEMEGAHYQKAIQAATRIRRAGPNDNVVLRYAYYASDNPLVTGHTLASGSLGVDGVKPTYLITVKMLNRILGNKAGKNEG